MIAALFVLPDGPYSLLPGIDLWPESRDARLYAGPHKVIAHPPCARWSRYWSGGPSARIRRVMGDDNGCFASALASVRQWGGVLEHPEASHAWPCHGLAKPPKSGEWIRADGIGGWTCCVEQGHYGHPARKATWLYVYGIEESRLPELLWGPWRGAATRLDQGYHSREERAREIKTGVCQRLSKRQRSLTPLPFARLLLSIAQLADPLPLRAALEAKRVRIKRASLLRRRHP